MKHSGKSLERPATKALKRREFLTTAVTATAATVVAASSFPKPSLSQGIKQWRLPTTSPKHFPRLGTRASHLGYSIT